MADPRDPRVTPARPVNESLDEIATGFSVFLQREEARSKETADALKEIARVQGRAQGGLAIHHAGIDDRSSFMPGMGAPAGVPGEPAPITPIALDPMRGNLGAQTRQGLRQRVVESVQRSAAQASADYAPSPGTMYDMQGNRVEIREGVSYNPVTGEYLDEVGNSLPFDEATAQIMSASEEAKLGRSASIKGMAANVAGAWGNGVPVGRAVMSMVPRRALLAAGAVGAGVFAADQALDFAQGQFDANQEYRSIYAGGHGEAFGMRARDWVTKNVWDRFNVGVDRGPFVDAGRQMALRGDDLDDYVATGRELSIESGMSPRKSVEIMNMALQAGQGLTNLAESIKQVNDAARDAGTNAARARDVFVANYQASSDIMFNATPGTRAALAAGATVAATDTLRQYQGIDSVISPLGSQSMQFATASRIGLSPTEMLSYIESTPGSAAIDNDETMRTILNQLRSDAGVPMGDVVRAWVDTLPGGYVSFYADDLGRMLLAEGFYPPTVQKLLRRFGINVDEGAALTTAGEFFTELSPGQVASDQMVESYQDKTTINLPGPADTYEETSELSIPGQMADEIMGNFGVDFNKTGRDATMKAFLEGRLGESVSFPGRSSTPEEIERFNEMASGALQDPTAGVASALIRMENQLGIQDDKADVAVVTPNGIRVVDFNTAMKHFPDQIQSGEAKFVGGVNDEYMDMSLADVIGIPAEETAPPSASGRGFYTSWEGDGSVAPEDWGAAGNVTYEEYIKDREASGRDDDDKTVRIELTPEASELFRVVGADANGLEPTSGG